jgi:hypothetical protein
MSVSLTWKPWMAGGRPDCRPINREEHPLGPLTTPQRMRDLEMKPLRPPTQYLQSYRCSIDEPFGEKVLAWTAMT